MIDFIADLRAQSFEGWTEDSINGYLTALETIQRRIEKKERLLIQIERLGRLYEDGEQLSNGNPTYFVTIVWHEIESLREENIKLKRRLSKAVDEVDLLKKKSRKQDVLLYALQPQGDEEK